MRTNQELLRALMAKHELTYKNVAALSGKSEHTVKAWLKPETSKSHLELMDDTLEIIYARCDEQLPKYKTAGVTTLKDIKKDRGK